MNTKNYEQHRAHHSHFVDEKSEVQKSQEACPRSHIEVVVDPGLWAY